MANPRILNTDGNDKPLEVTSADFDIAKHNAVITIEHDGEHRTFMIRTVQAGEKFGKPGERLVALLVGPDRSRDWDNFGFVRPGGVINVFRNRCKDSGKSPYQWFGLMLMNPAAWEVKGYAYLMQTFCMRCNRPLTVPSSILAGLGPTCRELVAA